MEFNKNTYLECVLESHKMKHVQTLVDLYKEKREKLINALKTKFTEESYSPINSGSYAKHTCINKKFDFDLVIPFKKNGDTLEKIFTNVFDFLNEEYKKTDIELSSITKQKVSIGLTFSIFKDNKYHQLSFDIVPGREVDDYEENNFLNLYVNENWGSIQKATYIQTNIQTHINLISKKSDERKIIRLLKIWKNSYSTSLKSFLIELITIKAFEKNEKNIPTDIWGKLEMVLNFIKDNIETISIADPANSSNIVTDTLQDYNKQEIKNSIESMLSYIASNEENIKLYFVVNSEFPCTEEKKSSYVIKDKTVPTYLSTNEFA